MDLTAIKNAINQQNQAASKVNNFCMTICTVNGSGSATANNTLYRAIFRMGIPVCGKNIFPSNIKGLPTWYSIRVSEAGYLGRVEHDDIIIAMNAKTFEKDLTYDVPGGVVFYADHIALPDTRHDIITYPMPIKELVKQTDAPRHLRDYMENMLYVGVVGKLLGIPMHYIEDALAAQFEGKPAVVQSNLNVVKLGFGWAAENLEKKDAYTVKPLSPLNDYIMTDGNIAGALGAMYGGLQFCSWYPITPATSLAESLNTFNPVLRKDPETGKDTCVIIQAEDELAAIGMCAGAAWAGLRSLTSTSGPGLSLMTEYMGMAYFTEIPVVVWDVQRVGPSTGMPTRTGQCDITMAYFLGHGDTQNILLFPGSVTECFEMSWQGLDIAEHYQTPVIIMGDLDLGMNQWMTKRFEYPETPIDRGKVLWEKDLEARAGKWGRYLDEDGDGIPYRTYMGNTHPNSAYFARGTGHDEYANYSEEPEVWERLMARIKTKILNAVEFLPKPEMKTEAGAKMGLICVGSVDAAVGEAQDILNQAGVGFDYLRIKALPACQMVFDFIDAHEINFVVELNRDGQLHQILTLEYAGCKDKLVSLAHMDGFPITAKWIVTQVLTCLEEK